MQFNVLKRPHLRLLASAAIAVPIFTQISSAWSDETKTAAIKTPSVSTAGKSDVKGDGAAPNSADGLLDPALPHEERWKRYQDAAKKYYALTPEQSAVVADIYKSCCERAEAARKESSDHPDDSKGRATSVGKPSALDKLTEEFVNRVDAIARKDQIDAASQRGFESPYKKSAPIRPEHGNPAPEFTLNNKEGKPVSLSQLRGKVVVVAFWASWCGYCKKTLPLIQSLHEQYQDNEEVEVYGIDCREKDPGNAKALAILKEKGYTFPVLFNGDPAASLYEVAGFPTVYAVGPDGKIIYKQRGHKDDVVKILTSVIDAALKTKPAGAASANSKSNG